jgi:hypothetical protein
MPEYRSISVSIISQFGLKAHPEFPHPEPATCSFAGPTKAMPILKHPDSENGLTRQSKRKQFDKSAPSFSTATSNLSSTGKADKILGRKPSMSVYIPSLAGKKFMKLDHKRVLALLIQTGTRFWLRYKIALSHSSVQYFYFKLYLDGRHITSWGTDPKIRPEGEIMRAPFQAQGKYDFDGDGSIFKHEGMEFRPFYFRPQDQENELSAATEGGCVEVMVYRARGKKRRPPMPEEFRGQENYGIL